jgi:hypothetical protein
VEKHLNDPVWVNSICLLHDGAATSSKAYGFSEANGFEVAVPINIIYWYFVVDISWPSQHFLRSIEFRTPDSVELRVQLEHQGHWTSWKGFASPIRLISALNGDELSLLEGRGKVTKLELTLCHTQNSDQFNARSPISVRGNPLSPRKTSQKMNAVYFFVVQE